MKYIKHILRNKWLSLAILLVVLVVGITTLSHSGNGSYKYVTVTRNDISEGVIVTGKTAPVKETKLGFEVTGKIAKIYKEVGDKAYAGEILAELDKSSLYSDLAETNAELSIEKLKLDQILKGAKVEEIDVQEAKVLSAETLLETNKQTLISSIYDSYTKTDDAIRNKLDSLYSNPKDSGVQFNIPVSNSQLKIDLESGRSGIEHLLVLVLGEVSDASSGNNIKKYYLDARNLLEKAKDLLDKAGIAINNATQSSSISQTTLATYKSDVSTARANINTTLTSLNTYIQAYESAASNLTVEQRTLDLKKSGGSPEEIAIQKASVVQAEAKLQSIKAKIAKATIYSPIAGVVTRRDAEDGEIANSNQNILTVYSDGGLILEANMPETNIGKISLGNNISLTIDAFPGEKFTAKIIEIEPGDKIVDGVVNFKIKASFNDLDVRIKSGLTSTLNIETFKKENALTIPQSAITKENNEAFVKKIVDGKSENVKVQTGIENADGLVEIVSGLDYGDEVVDFGASK